MPLSHAVLYLVCPDWVGAHHLIDAAIAGFDVHSDKYMNAFLVDVLYELEALADMVRRLAQMGRHENRLPQVRHAPEVIMAMPLNRMLLRCD